MSDKLRYLQEHKPHFGVAYFVRHSDLAPGDVISFKYKGEMRWVFVLDPEYQGKLHGLTLGLTPRQALIDTVIDPMFDHTSPISLYGQAIFKVASRWDSYRTFIISEMGTIRRMGYYVKPKPVFKDGKRVE
jgi:hypothetical protein